MSTTSSRRGTREARDLRGLEQAFVFVRAARHEFRQVFRADYREREGFEIAVDRRDEHVAAGATSCAEHRHRLRAGSGTCSSISMQVTHVEFAGMRDRAAASADSTR